MDDASTSALLLAPPEADPLVRRLPSRAEVLLHWLAGQPLVVPAVGLAVGIAIDAACAPPFIAAVGLFLIASILLFFPRGHESLHHVAVFIAAIAVGAPLHDLAFRRLPRNHIVLYSNRMPVSVRLTGTIID